MIRRGFVENSLLVEQKRSVEDDKARLNTNLGEIAGRLTFGEVNPILSSSPTSENEFEQLMQIPNCDETSGHSFDWSSTRVYPHCESNETG